MSSFNQLPETGYLRLCQIIGTKSTPALIPVCKSTWWAGVASGRYPQSVKLGPNITAWRVEDIREFMNRVNESSV